MISGVKILMSRDKKVSLAELMGADASGSKGPGLTLSQLPKILGDAMPELPKNPLGRHRLIRSLQQRYGKNFRSLPGIKELVKQFDNEIEFEKKVAQMKNLRAGK